MRPLSFRAQEGFGLVETLVAAVVLAVGLLGSFMMLNSTVDASAVARAREGGVTLAREITEDARSIPYSQLSNSTIAAQLQAMPGLASSSPGGPWTIVRRGVTYTVTASVTTINDPKDTSGAVDIKQVAAAVSWTTYPNTSHQVTETTTMTRAGQDVGLATSNLQLATQGVSSSATQPVITSPTVSSLSFSVTAPTGTTAIIWTLNGVKQSSWNGSAPSSGTTWTSAGWSLTGVSDGTYQVGAQAEDANGVIGPAVTIPVNLIRNTPSAPNVTGYGFNTNLLVSGSASTVAELEWSSNPELNVTGYRIYNPSGSVICANTTSTYDASCGASAWCSTPTACIDLSPPSPTSSNLVYKVVALYYDANGVLQEGSAKTVTLASGIPVPPASPPSVTVTSQSDGSAILTWTAPSGGTPVSFYRIYRDGTNYTNRYDTVTCSSNCTYHDVNRFESHNYWVTAVGGTTPGANMAESTATGPASG